MLDAADAVLVARAREGLVVTRAHFNHAGMSLLPAESLDRIGAHLQLEAEIGGYEAAAAVADELAAVPDALAPLFGPEVAADEVTVVESASRASELIVWSMAETFGWGVDDRVLVDQFTYATVHSALMALRAARGVSIDVAPARPDGAVDPEALADALDDRTKLVAITHMPTHVGTVSDVEAVGRIVAHHDAVYLLDVAQTLGQMPVDVRAIGCQVAFAPGRKFLRAPRGTGALFVSAPLAEQLVPLTPGFGAVDVEGHQPFALAPATRRFDSFEGDIAGRLALAVSARHSTAVGLDTIGRLVGARSAELATLLGSVEGVRLLDPGAVGIVSFVHDRLEPDEIRGRLSAEGVNVWVNPAAGSPIDGARRPVLPSVRVSPHYLTDDDDLARLGRALDVLG
ncbi:MAG: aminotransferase class V-fold PLP-dependent enzyme [Acidimicrobiales bacterium]